MPCLKATVVANFVVPVPDYVRFATHYGFRPDFCAAALQYAVTLPGVGGDHTFTLNYSASTGTAYFSRRTVIDSGVTQFAYFRTRSNHAFTDVSSASKSSTSGAT
jgi:hypothetical protein